MNKGRGKNKYHKNQSKKTQTISSGIGENSIKTTNGESPQETYKENPEKNLSFLNYEEFRKANRISERQFWVNSILAFVTAGVFVLSYLQYQSAKISANAAINAVKLSSNQFEIENTPYLTVAQIKVIEFVANKPIRLNYAYLNVGSQIVKLKSSKVGFALESSTFMNNTIEQTNYINKLIPGESTIAYVSDKIPYLANFTSKNTVNKDSFDALSEGELNFYMLGETIYENVNSHKERKLTFVFKLVSQNPIPEVITLRIENTDI